MAAECRSSGASIERLPTEILELIAHAVRHNSLKDLTSLIRVSSRWCELGLALIWHDVTITKSNIGPFGVVLLKHSHLPKRINSLSLNVRLSYDEYSLTSKVADHIKRLSKVLPDMQCLTTFSFKHHIDQSSPYPASAMTNDLILSLVWSLPSGLQNLEIDSAVMYFTQHLHERCLCSVVSERFHELRSLRLAYPRLCWKLLQHPSNTLRYLVINAIMTNFRPGLRGCDVNGEQARLSWDALQEQRITTSINTVRKFLETVQEKVIKENIFPQLQTLLILEPYYFPSETSLNFFSTNIHHTSAEDPTRITTYCYPTWTNDCKLHFILRQCAHPPPNEKKKPTTVTSGHDCSTEDIAGTSAELRSTLEGVAGWSTSKHGKRCPRYLLPTPPSPSTTTPTSISTLPIDRNVAPKLHRSSIPLSNSTSTSISPPIETTFRFLSLPNLHLSTNMIISNPSPEKTAQILGNQIWRAEAAAQRSLLCGRIYNNTNKNSTMLESLEAKDFAI